MKVGLVNMGLSHLVDCLTKSQIKDTFKWFAEQTF